MRYEVVTKMMKINSFMAESQKSSKVPVAEKKIVDTELIIVIQLSFRNVTHLSDSH